MSMPAQPGGVPVPDAPPPTEPVTRPVDQPVTEPVDVPPAPGAARPPAEQPAATAAPDGTDDTDDTGPVAGPSEATDWSTLEDGALLAAHVAGSEGAFGELFRRHRDRLWAVALRTTGNPEDAADGLQDAMIAAYRRAGSFRGDAAVTTWLHRVVVNACLDRLRAAKVRRTQPLPEDLEEHRSAGLVSHEAPDQPDAASVRAEEGRAVLAALATLPADQRAALVLVDMEGYPVAEAAHMLDCPVGTVKSRCSRGRARLAVLLAPLLTDTSAGEQRHHDPGNPGGAPHVGPTSARAPPAP